MINRVSNKNNLSIFDVLAEQETTQTRSNEDKTIKTDWSGKMASREPEMKSSWREKRKADKEATRVENLKDRKVSKAQHLRHNQTEDIDLSRNHKSIRSAACAVTENDSSLKDIGGSSASLDKHNSIFDSNRIQDSLSKVSFQEQLQKDENKRKEKSKEHRNGIREASLPDVDNEDFAFRHKNTLIRSGRDGSQDSSQAQRRLAAPTKNISMFDGADFENFKPTCGESMEKKKQKDKEKVSSSEGISTSKIQSRMFDALSDDQEVIVTKKADKKSNETLDGLINILNEKYKNEHI